MYRNGPNTSAIVKAALGIMVVCALCTANVLAHQSPHAPPLDPACVMALRSIDEDSGTAQTHLLASHPHSHQTRSNYTIYCILTVLGDPMITLTKAFTCTDVM